MARRPVKGGAPRRATLLAIVLVEFAGMIGAPAGTASKTKIVNVGHRGASGIAPEHTLPAYRKALAHGADYIEQDLQMTGDGVLVVLHDETLDRTARGPKQNCTGLVATKTLEAIKTCDVGSWFNDAYPDLARPGYVGLKVPTLQQVLGRFGRKTNYYIELKTPELYPGMEEALLDVLARFDLIGPAKRSRRVLIQSFHPSSLQKVHALAPALPLIQLYPGMGSQAVRQTLDQTATYAVGIGPSFSSVDAELVEEAHKRCLAVHPYTVNARADMRSVIEAGADGMFTNFPERLESLSGKRAYLDPLMSGLRPAAEYGDCSG
jgi:glycerophosphoryl diester phosphodiesterase